MAEIRHRCHFSLPQYELVPWQELTTFPALAFVKQDRVGESGGFLGERLVRCQRKQE